MHKMLKDDKYSIQKKEEKYIIFTFINCHLYFLFITFVQAKFSKKKKIIKNNYILNKRIPAILMFTTTAFSTLIYYLYIFIQY